MVSFKLGVNRSSLGEGPGAEQGGVGWVVNGQAKRKDVIKAQQWPRTDVVHVCNACPRSLHDPCKSLLPSPHCINHVFHFLCFMML